ncbi:MAG TPA: peroxide stress protein YaaA [Acidimicrobiales bacterium]|nr:peroxide stress protein YaaA [Acidimicrobiales bacterium]
MSGTPFVLLPPSEAKAAGGGAPPSLGTFDAPLATFRLRVATALETSLRRATRAERERIFNARGELGERALLATRAYLEGSAPLLEAWRRYEGVVWRHFEPATLDTEERSRVLIPSALYGLTSANDAIADYRLKMSVRLKSLGVLSGYWRTPLSEVLAAHVGEATLVDLLPGEHASAFDFSALRAAATLVRVSFVDRHRARAVGHEAKAVKGVVARHVLREGLANFEGLSWEGWRVERHETGFVVAAPPS